MNYTLHISEVLSDRVSAQFKTIFDRQFTTCLHSTQKTSVICFNVEQACYTGNMSPDNLNDGKLLANFLPPNSAATSNDCKNDDLCDNPFMNLTKKLLNYANITTKTTISKTLTQT